MIAELLKLRKGVNTGLKRKKELDEYTTKTGVADRCPLMRLEYFDPIRDCPIDMMHTGSC